MELVSDPNDRAWGIESLASQPVQDDNSGFSEGDVSLSTQKQIYGNMAHSIGIDLGDPEDPVAAMVRAGIDDLDPTRVLRDCNYLFVALSQNGFGFVQSLVASRLQLFTLGPKVIHCTLHRYARQGETLDSVYKEFKRDFCDRCPDRVPRSTGWQYSRKWQLEENKRNKEFIWAIVIFVAPGCQLFIHPLLDFG